LEPRPKWIKRIAGRRFGWLAYLIVGVPSAIGFPGIQARVTVDEQAVSGSFVQVLVANSRLYGGGMMQLSPDASLDDGCLDVWLFKGKMVFQTIGHAIRMMISPNRANSNTIHLRGRQVLVEAKGPSLIELDGESAGRSPLSVCIEPQSLHLLVPQTAPDNLFCRSGYSFHIVERVL
jgi:diacylglycerol kinase family enzyme